MPPTAGLQRLPTAMAQRLWLHDKMLFILFHFTNTMLPLDSTDSRWLPVAPSGSQWLLVTPIDLNLTLFVAPDGS